MTIILADLVTRLQADVPSQGGVPSSTQYTQAVKDAVGDLSRRASVVRSSTLSVVAGTASYALPSDFVKFIKLSAIGVAQGAIWNTPAGLVPMSDTMRETYTIVGTTLIISPTPAFSADRTLVYAAGDAIDGTDSYPTLTEERARVALLYAQAACLDGIALSGRADAVLIESTIEGVARERLDTTKRGAELRASAAYLRDAYMQAVAALNVGAGGMGGAWC